MAEDDESWDASTEAMRRTMLRANGDEDISALFWNRASKREHTVAAEKLVLFALESRLAVNSPKGVRPDRRERRPDQ